MCVWKLPSNFLLFFLRVTCQINKTKIMEKQFEQRLPSSQTFSSKFRDKASQNFLFHLQHSCDKSVKVHRIQLEQFRGKELSFLTILGQNTVKAILTLRRAMVATIIFRLWLKCCRQSMTGHRYLPSSAGRSHWFLCPIHLRILYALLHRIGRCEEIIRAEDSENSPPSSIILGV